MLNEIKPCPFCGYDYPIHSPGKGYTCRSSRCKGHAPFIGVWNTRYVEDELRKQLETERKVVEQVQKTMDSIQRNNERLEGELLGLREENERLRECSEKDRRNDEAKLTLGDIKALLRHHGRIER